MDNVVVQVVPLHNSSREERVSKLFSSAWVDYESSVIVPYVTVYGVARCKVLVCTRVDKSTRLIFLKFCSELNLCTVYLKKKVFVTITHVEIKVMIIITSIVVFHFLRVLVTGNDDIICSDVNRRCDDSVYAGSRLEEEARWFAAL